MNQINIDSLLSIGSSTKIEPQLKLDTTQLYQALLKIGSDGSGQLQVAAGSHSVKIALSTAELQQLVRSTTSTSSQVTLSNTRIETPKQLPLDGSVWQVKLQPINENFITLAIQKPAQQLPISEAAVFKWLQQVGQQLQQIDKTAAALNPQALQLQVLVTRNHDKLLVSVDPSRPQIALPIPQFSDKQQQTLVSQIPQLHQRTPAQHGLLHLSLHNGQIQLKLELSLANPNNTGKQSTSQTISAGGNAVPVATDLPANSARNVAGLAIGHSGVAPESRERLQSTERLLSNEQSPERLQSRELSPERLQSRELSPERSQNSSGVKISVQPLASAQSHDVRPSAPETKLTMQFSREQVKALLPVLTKQLVNQDLTLHHQQLAIAEKTTRTAELAPRTLSAEQWQLKTTAQQWQVEVQTAQPLKEIKVSLKEIDKPLHFLQNTAPIINKLATSATQFDMPQLWRQLLPLTSPVDPLRLSPELPAGVQALLQELKANTLDHQKVPAPAELQAQLTAALQFSPQQTQPNAMTAAGALAIALQLLIGRLASSAGDTNRPMAGKEKMQQLVGQLNETQSGQLLKQLSGHSAQLQQAQFANIEQQAQAKTEHPQLFLQLPVLVQGQQQFVELAISEREADGKGAEGKKRAWQLTMKFQLPEQGHLLVQVHLVDAEVSMQFYAETEQTQQLTSQWLPLFKDRLKVQGLEIKDIQVQRGKIPEHLYQRGTSLLQIKV
jgi:hypothetical protein